MTLRDWSVSEYWRRWSLSRSIWICVALGVFLSGCAPVKTMVGVGEPDLAQINPGLQRSAAEKILGERLWHVGAADGLTYDIYQYQKEQSARPILGLVVLGLDFLSLGSLELMDHPHDFRPAEQVAVAYDNQGRVVFVSKPWTVSDTGPCRRQRYLIPEGSGVPASTCPVPVKDLSGAALNSAILEDDDQDIETIDGHVPEEDVMELPPGRHEVDNHGVVATVEFFPGRRYRVEHEHFYGYARYRPFIFIEDVDSRETLVCINPLFIHY